MIATTIVREARADCDPGVGQSLARVSEAFSGGDANGGSENVSGRGCMSADGRWIVFTSAASNLLAAGQPADSNNRKDVLLRDNVDGSTKLVSVNRFGTASANGDSVNARITPDGRFVVFESAASNLVAGDTNNVRDVFVRDLATGTTTLASRPNAGGLSSRESFFPEMSADGRLVVFSSGDGNLVTGDSNGRIDIFVRDLTAGTTRMVSRNSANSNGGNGLSTDAHISGDGAYVVFTSAASDLVAGDTNGTTDVFRRNLLTNSTELVSATPGGAPGNAASGSTAQSNRIAISSNGEVIAFESRASNLTSLPDQNANTDIFVRDMRAGTTSLASANQAGSAAGSGQSRDPDLSADGRVVAFDSTAGDLVPLDGNGTFDVFVRDLNQDVTTLVSHSVASTDGGTGGQSNFPTLSSDGRYVAYASRADDPAPVSEPIGFDNVFWYDRATDTTELVSRNTAGTGGANAHAFRIGISGNGKFVAFTTSATNLTPGDGNGASDVFVSPSAFRPGTVRFSDAMLRRHEDSDEFKIEILRTDGCDGTVTVNLSSADETATVADDDYKSLSIVVKFGPGETSKTLKLRVNADEQLEWDESFALKLDSPSGGATVGEPSAMRIIVINDD
jgi:Tol biopolymer transport system component